MEYEEEIIKECIHSNLLRIHSAVFKDYQLNPRHSTPSVTHEICSGYESELLMVVPLFPVFKSAAHTGNLSRTL
jgi:hypothetical protein